MKPTLLIVDDEPGIVDTMKAYFSPQYQVLTAYSGGEITEFTGNQVILPDRFTSKYGIEQGNTITLRIGGQPVSLEVAEIAAYDTVFLRHTRGATALLPVVTLSGLLGQTDGYTKILVEPADGVSTSALKNELTAALPDSQYQVSEVVNEEIGRAHV